MLMSPKAIASAGHSGGCPVRAASPLMRALSEHVPAQLELEPVSERDALLQRLRLRLADGPMRILVLRADRLDAITHIAGEAMAGRVRTAILARLARFAKRGAVIAELPGSLFALMQPAGDDAPKTLAARVSAALSQPVVTGKSAFFVHIKAGVFHIDPQGDPDAQLVAALSDELAAGSDDAPQSVVSLT